MSTEADQLVNILEMTDNVCKQFLLVYNVSLPHD